MNDPVQVELFPLGRILRVNRGDSLQEILFTHGVEFPCGGRGSCKGCKVRVRSGQLRVTQEDASSLSAAELAEGWRLACRARAESNLQIDLAQWETVILSDNSRFDFEPRPGLGVAVDVGTTTIVAQLLDLTTGQVLAVRSALNEQAKHGSDVMSRVEFGLSGQGQSELQRIIRSQIGNLIEELLLGANLNGSSPGYPGTARADKPVVESIVLVGNTVMHHLFNGLTVEPLSEYPFITAAGGLQVKTTAELRWQVPGDPKTYFLPCLGGFVGSDLLAGVLATNLNKRDSLSLLIDLGTNGEIVLGNCERLLCAATAAGPAFEGARISMGMRAATGAIDAVTASGDRLLCHVLGNTTPRGICGSGLVDAVAVSLDLGLIRSTGRMVKGDSLELATPVSITQRDVRELQLAKGAIAAGVRLLLQHWGATPDQVTQVFLAGAFGNYVNQANARRIGLLQFPADKIVPAGNTALLGAKLALFRLPQSELTYPEIVAKTGHVSLNEVPGFQEVYAEEMVFP